jgi:hypothetical protein
MSELKRIYYPQELEVCQQNAQTINITVGDVELELSVGLAETLARSILLKCAATKE